MPTVRELLTTWGFDVDFSTLDRMDKKVGELSKDVKGVGKNIDEFAKGLVSAGTKLTAFATIPIVGLGAAMINIASDASETRSKFNTVFKDIQTESNQTAKTLGKDFGIGRDKARELLSSTGDLLTGFGFTQKSSLDLSRQVQELAVDLVSFTNFEGGAESASMALTKALLGERESVKTLGISILEKDVKTQAALNTAEGLVFETERQAKAYATLQIAQNQSKNAIGDYARTQMEFANQSRELRTDIHDLAIEFGDILLPIAGQLIQKLRSVTFWISGLDVQTKETILQVAGLVAVMGPAILILGVLGLSFLFVAKSIKGLKLAILGLARLFSWPFTIALAISSALAIIADDIEHWVDGNKSVLGEWVGDWESAKNNILGFLDDLDNAVAEFFRNPFGIDQKIDEWINEIKSGFGSLEGFLNFSGIFGGDFAPTNRQILGYTGLIGEGFSRPQQSSRDLNIEATVNVQVPHGTTEQQANFLKNEAKKSFSEEFRELIGNAQKEFPRFE